MLEQSHEKCRLLTNTTVDKGFCVCSPVLVKIYKFVNGNIYISIWDTHRHPHTLTLPHTPSLTHTPSHTHTLTHTHTPSHTHTLTHPPSLTHPHTHTHTLAHTLLVLAITARGF